MTRNSTRTRQTPAKTPRKSPDQPASGSAVASCQPRAQTSELCFEACDRPWRLLRADMEALWEGMTDERHPLWPLWEKDERLPYWAELWPSSLALASFLSERKADLAGRPCLDVGCGLGFTALVGQWLGGRVLGMDYDPEALRYARRNAQLNNVSGVTWAVMDWRQPALQPNSMERVWAADIVYEKRFAEPVAAFLNHVLTEDGVAWVAEPGRPIFACLLEALPHHGLDFARVRTVPTWPLTPQDVPVPVSLWEIRRTSGIAPERQRALTRLP